ncbi:MAG: apolipoprotein N-acyltransferase [Pseudomonadota bacterium]
MDVARLRSDTLASLRPTVLAVFFAAVGAIGALGHPPAGMLPLTVISLGAFLWLRPWELSLRRAAIAGWGYGAGYFALTLHWIVEPFLVDVARHGWMAPFALFLMAGGLALFWGAAAALAAWRRSGLVFVLAFAGAELARAHLFGGFPWGMHVTAFVDVALYQGAAWLGPHGLTLAVALALLGLVEGVRAAGARASLPRVAARRLMGLALALGLGLAVFLPPLEAPAAAGDAPLIRTVQPNAAQQLKWREDMRPLFLERKMRATAARPHADFVIWPEVALTTWLQEGGITFTEAAQRGRGAEIFIGAQSWRDGQAWNALAHVGAGGDLRGVYEKHHLVPFGEYMPLGWLFSRAGIYGLAANEGFGFAAGAGPKVLDVTGIGPVQPLICYESIFAHEVGRGVDRPRLIAVVTNDAWFGQLGGPAQHLMQSQARAIEQGLPVARSANTGISAIIDARGRLVAYLPLGRSGHADAALPAALPPTLYARLGEVPFAALAAIALLSHMLARHLSPGRFQD